MNERKLNQLFKAARSDTPPLPPEGFDMDVMRATRQEPIAAAPQMQTDSLADELNRWFPRIAWGAVTVIAVCVAADLALTAAGVPGVSDGVSQISRQWLSLST